MICKSRTWKNKTAIDLSAAGKQLNGLLLPSGEYSFVTLALTKTSAEYHTFNST
jgi:hypothetical protein